jgi:hypothetical protein
MHVGEMTKLDESSSQLTICFRMKDASDFETGAIDIDAPVISLLQQAAPSKSISIDSPDRSIAAFATG